MTAASRVLRQTLVRTFLYSGAVCAFAAASGLAPAAAQDASTEPGRIEDRLELPEAPAAPLDPIATPEPKPPAPAAPAPPVKPVILTGVVITGATVYPAAALADLYEPYLGLAVGTKDIERILASITGKYRADGYFLSRAVVPSQRVEYGILNIKVIEGYIERVDFQGEIRGRRSLLDRVARRITAERPTTLPMLERNLLLIGDLPGVTVTPSLRETAPMSSAYKLDIKLAHDRYQIIASLDNRGTDPIGPLQTQLGASLNSVLGWYETSRVRLFTVPDDPRELLYGELYFDYPVGSFGTRALLTGAYSNIDTEAQVDGTTIFGNSTRVAVGMSHPVIRARRRTLTVGGELDYLDSRQKASGSTSRDRVRSVRLTAAGAFADSLGGATTLRVAASQGLNILGARESGSSRLSRPAGRSDYTKVAGSVSRRQRLPLGLEARLAATGQKAASQLLSSEEFALGGGPFGRAYDPSELSGKDGAAGLVELGFLAEPKRRVLRAFRFFGFYELGAVWNATVGRQSMASAGIGLRLDLKPGIRVVAEWAEPLTRPVATEGDNRGRFFFRAQARF